jgi:hypothetical protein
VSIASVMVDIASAIVVVSGCSCVTIAIAVHLLFLLVPPEFLPLSWPLPSVVA